MRWWLLAMGVAGAHEPGLSYARFVDGALILTFAAADIERLAGGDGIATRERILGATLDACRVRTAIGACELGPGDVQRVEGDGVELRAPVRCPDDGARTVDADYLQRLPDGHRLIVIGDDDELTTLTASSAAPARSTAAAFLRLGVEHILTGWDHLAFVGALVLGARGARELLTLVTTFTVAHSITLALAVTGVVQAPSAVVEPLIAASIVFVAIENLWRPPLARRAVITFGFGLIHGLGFAGLLRELGLPADASTTALVAFNAGVEIGQLAAVSALLLALAAVDRATDASPRTRIAGTAALAIAGAVWLVERVIGELG